MDLTEYSDNELSLVVFNDEVLYNMRHHKGFVDLLREYYIFTQDQLDVLNQDLSDDLNEETA